MALTKTVEIRVSPVTRYMVTMHTSEFDPEQRYGSARSEPLGVFDSAKYADMVAAAVAAHEGGTVVGRGDSGSP